MVPGERGLSQQPPATSAAASADQLQLDFTNPAAPAQDGQLAVIGVYRFKTDRMVFDLGFMRSVTQPCSTR